MCLIFSLGGFCRGVLFGDLEFADGRITGIFLRR